MRNGKKNGGTGDLGPGARTARAEAEQHLAAQLAGRVLLGAAKGDNGGNRQRPPRGHILPPQRGDCSVATGFQPVDRCPRRLRFFFCPSPGGATERRSIAPQRGSGIRKQGWSAARLPRVQNPWLQNTRTLRHWQSEATNGIGSRHHGPGRAGLAACSCARQQRVVQDRAIEDCATGTACLRPRDQLPRRVSKTKEERWGGVNPTTYCVRLLTNGRRSRYVNWPREEVA
jgi:hypothetical protein